MVQILLFAKIVIFFEREVEYFSHTAMKCILGGKTQLMVDATIQAETGKDASKPQGPAKKQRDAQYSKEEMFQSKIANAISSG